MAGTPSSSRPARPAAGPRCRPAPFLPRFASPQSPGFQGTHHFLPQGRRRSRAADHGAPGSILSGPASCLFPPNSNTALLSPALPLEDQGLVGGREGRWWGERAGLRLGVGASTGGPGLPAPQMCIPVGPSLSLRHTSQWTEDTKSWPAKLDRPRGPAGTGHVLYGFGELAGHPAPRLGRCAGLWVQGGQSFRLQQNLEIWTVLHVVSWFLDGGTNQAKCSSKNTVSPTKSHPWLHSDCGPRERPLITRPRAAGS